MKANSARMGLDTSKYIVMMSLNGNRVQNDFSELAELSRQLSRIGNCINQLAKKVNTINNIYAEDYERMKEENVRLCLTLNRAIFMLRRTAA